MMPLLLFSSGHHLVFLLRCEAVDAWTSSSRSALVLAHHMVL